MARNGSGTYSLPAGNPVVTGTVISSTTQNNTMTDVATALTQSLAYDGQTLPIANLPMGTYRHTGVSDGVAATDYASYKQLQNSSGQTLGTIAGTNTITAQGTPTITAYVAGQRFSFIPAAQNTGATTLNIDSLGAKNIYFNGTALVGGELPAKRLTVEYDGTQFNLMAKSGGIINTVKSASIASAATVDLSTATGNEVHVTGNTGPITSFGTVAAGTKFTLIFDSTPTITYNGTSMILNTGGIDFTATAGDRAEAVSEGSGNWVVNVIKKDGTANTAAAAPTLGNFAQGFRLTLTSGTAVTTGDVTGATTIYAIPCKGKYIDLYDGVSTWNRRTSAEFSLALGTLTSGKPYDVFCYDNATVPTLEFLVWTNDTTRATALVYQDGVLVKSGATTRRYMGTFYTTATTTTEDSNAKRYLWNYYHRQRRNLYKTDATVTWNYTTNTFRQANANAANQVEAVVGVMEDAVELQVTCMVENSTGAVPETVGIGIDSTSASSATLNTQWMGAVSIRGMASAYYRGYPAVGRHAYAWLEKSTASGTASWYGNGTDIISGITGSVIG